MQSGKRVFRYDNAPHHPEISTHPHHKHAGVRDTLSPTVEPMLAQILEEIEKLLEDK
jgi:hypothetical protein